MWLVCGKEPQFPKKKNPVVSQKQQHLRIPKFLAGLVLRFTVVADIRGKRYGFPTDVSIAARVGAKPWIFGAIFFEIVTAHLGSLLRSH